MTQRILFPHTAWFLLLLIPAIPVGFYPRYFSLSASSISWMVLTHFFFMLLWAVLSIAQPFLIYQKKKGYSPVPALIVAGGYALSLVTVIVLSKTHIWQLFEELLLMR